MKVAAYCLAEFLGITTQAVGGKPLTAPPLSAATFAPGLLEGAEFLYFDMHGSAGAPFWDDGYSTPTLYANTLRECDLRGVVAFTTACHAGDKSSPMLDALLYAGCSYVVAGEGENYTTTRISGAAQLGRLFFRAYRKGATPPAALSIAKRFYRSLSKDPAQVKADTLRFSIFNRG